MCCEMETSKGRPTDDYDLLFVTSSCAEQLNGGAALATLSFQIFHPQQQALVVAMFSKTLTQERSRNLHNIIPQG
jgi:hypothetical protein